MKNVILCLSLMFLLPSQALAGNDPSIQRAQRQDIQKAMAQHIQSHSHQGKYLVYDAVAGQLKHLKLKALHTGIVKKNGFFVSCADFVDRNGKLYDLDMLVLQRGKGYQVVESVVHAVAGKKRKYHLES